MNSFTMIRISKDKNNVLVFRVLYPCIIARIRFRYSFKLNNLAIFEFQAKYTVRLIDLGICLSHFELSARWIGLEGVWVKLNPGGNFELPDVEYKISWIGK